MDFITLDFLTEKSHVGQLFNQTYKVYMLNMARNDFRIENVLRAKFESQNARFSRRKHFARKI